MFSLCDSYVDNTVIREQDIIDIITILPSNKAIGSDTINHKMLKNTIYTIVKPLCLLFNISSNDCIFHCSSKITNALPLFKKDYPSEPSNYRPVSLLSCVIMERIVFEHLYNFFMKKFILQIPGGFLTGHSTVYQLIETYDCILKAIDEGKTTCIVFCDLSKAFDRV